MTVDVDAGLSGSWAVAAKEDHHEGDGHDKTRGAHANQHLVVPRHGHAMPHGEKGGITVWAGHSSLVRYIQVVRLTQLSLRDQQSGQQRRVDRDWCAERIEREKTNL